MVLEVNGVTWSYSDKKPVHFIARLRPRVPGTIAWCETDDIGAWWSGESRGRLWVA